MNAHERLRQAIDRAQDRLRAEVPPDRQAAIIAILRARDQRLPWPGGEPSPDLVSGRRLSDPGGNKALQICLESTAESEETAATPECGEQDLGEWAQRFLAECDRLAEAELVLAHCQTGFMRLVERGEGDFAAWIATKRAPTIWRERADLDWWAGWLARRHSLAPGEPRAERPASAGDGPEPATFYRRLAGVWLERLSYQLAYPPDAEIGGCTVRTYRDVLGLLIAWALQA